MLIKSYKYLIYSTLQTTFTFIQIAMSVCYVTNYHCFPIHCSRTACCIEKSTKTLMNLLERAAGPVVCFAGFYAKFQIRKRVEVSPIALLQQSFQFLSNLAVCQQMVNRWFKQHNERFNVIITNSASLCHAIVSFFYRGLISAHCVSTA